MKSEELAELARLANISLDEGEAEALLPEFKNILVSLAEMQNAVEDFTAFPDGLADETGSATVNASSFYSVNPICDSVNEDLLNNASKRDGRFIVIPNILGKMNGV